MEKLNGFLQGEQKEKWILFALRIPPNTKAQIEAKALGRRTTQSEIVRQAIDEFLLAYAENEQEKMAAEVAARERKEKLGLAEPKDGFRTEMQIRSAWDTIIKARRSYEEMGVLRSFHYPIWKKRLRENMEAIDDSNPIKEEAKKTYLLLIAKLDQEEMKLREKELREEQKQLDEPPQAF